MPAQPKETLEQLLNHLGFPARIEEREVDGFVTLDVQAEDSGRLVGRQGQTLGALQYLLNRLLIRQDPAAPKITVDIGGYRAEAREALVRKAQAAADKVRQWGDIVELEPLGAYERRIVHHALKDDPAVETQSVEVDGTDKKVILLRPRRTP